MQALCTDTEGIAAHRKERYGVALVRSNWVPFARLRKESFMPAIQYPDVEGGEGRSR